MSAQLLTDPFLQAPTSTSVRVVWFTEFPGQRHQVSYGPDLAQTVMATSRPLSRTSEDARSHIPHPPAQVAARPIWRHEAEITGLQPNQRLPYHVQSQREDGAIAQSEIYSLAAKPSPGSPLTILLTSDHQLKPLTAVNLQKVVETVGQVDAVWFAGDLVNVPDRASEWFDDLRGNAFFPVLQGRATYDLETNGQVTRYYGGPVIQSAPLYPALGNHEVMGRYHPAQDLHTQFGDAIPRPIAETLYADELAALRDPYQHQQTLKNYSFNTDTYDEIFTLPQRTTNTPYYADTFGDVRLVVLYVAAVWRSPSLEGSVRGRYCERQADFNQPEHWGYGHHIFESIAPGSPQFTWLQDELQSAAFQQAKYKVVMFHHPPHSLGNNCVPAYTDPIQRIERDIQGNITVIRYDYPKSADYLIRDLVPLLETAGVQLVLYGHSHLWNRFVSPQGLHFLETSNVGNSYGAHVNGNPRPVPIGDDYTALGNPNGLEPIIPTIAPLLDEAGQPLPYIASNDLTVFTVFETATGTVSSYWFDARKPNSEVVKFDQFHLGE